MGFESAVARLHRLPFRIVVAAALLGVLPSCALSSFTTARTMPKGTSQFVVAPSALRVGIAGPAETMPFMEVGARYAFTDAVEGGFKIGYGAQFDAKISLFRSPGDESGLALALAPGLGYIGNLSGTPSGAGGDDIHFAGATLPLLVGWRFRPDLELTAGPRLLWLLQYVETTAGSTANSIGAGASLSLSYQLFDAVAVVPEVSYAVPFWRSLTGVGSIFGTGEQKAMQLGVGFVFGRRAR